jgi:hypothetical protein
MRRLPLAVTVLPGEVAMVLLAEEGMVPLVGERSDLRGVVRLLVRLLVLPRADSAARLRALPVDSARLRPHRAPSVSLLEWPRPVAWAPPWPAPSRPSCRKRSTPGR